MTFTQLLAFAQSSGCRVCADSRKVQKGDIFVAINGTNLDGHAFIQQAMANGADFIVAHKAVPDAPCVVVEDTSAALGQLAQAACGFPNQQLTNLAVTGTNGKTTTAFMVRSIIEQTEDLCGLIGTIEYSTGKVTVPAAMTTPDATMVARAARDMVDSGARYMVIEASSHALSQKRLAGISFTAAAFTNLTGDHLDYHRTFDDYLAAKILLFTGLPPHGLAILNAHSDASKAIAEKIAPARRVLWYAVEQPADITASVHHMDASGTQFSIIFNDYSEKVALKLPGGHNVQNALAATGLCLAAGISLHDIAKGLSALDAVPGRLQPVNSPNAQKRGIQVFVDYAHTDDALINVMNTLKPLCRGRLIVLFGCGGDRDKTKRPRMARAVEQMADMAIVTSDNPRTEDARRIIEDILAGFQRPTAENVFVEPDRAKAISAALQHARCGDIVLLAGKGHEDYQIIGTEKRHFSDVEEALKALDGAA
ncbi:MAG: UDP-N-acetylmuramoyl-L-alanyl-D-glutamate--2,6-diaminopimelate ligase [Planctomycetaceae bacterium]|nr:UDP-N-acetylmuramoyl-L-alanyl-D-glutamate--2,6-diaminopimelate ligase [Planctomycetaceae bacterium]